MDQGLDNYQHGTPVVGFSLSFCVSDILRGRVRIEDVRMIYCSFKFYGRDVFIRETLEAYGKGYWSGNPDEGKRIALILLDSGRITFCGGKYLRQKWMSMQEFQNKFGDDINQYQEKVRAEYSTYRDPSDVITIPVRQQWQMEDVHAGEVKVQIDPPEWID